MKPCRILHRGQFGVEGHRQAVDADDIDVALGEFAETPGLRTLAAPDPLHLIALEREDQVVEMLRHIARERHGQVVMQAQPRLTAGLLVRLQPLDRIDFLVGLALGQQHLEFLDRGGLDRREAIAFKGRADLVQHGLLHHAHFGKMFWKARNRARAVCHGVAV